MEKTEFQRLLDGADWCFEYADDPKAYSRGREQVRDVYRYAKGNAEFEAMIEAKRKDIGI